MRIVRQFIAGAEAHTTVSVLEGLVRIARQFIAGAETHNGFSPGGTAEATHPHGLRVRKDLPVPEGLVRIARQFIAGSGGIYKQKRNYVKFTITHKTPD